MTLPPKLERELEELRADNEVEVVEDPDFVNVILKGFPLGDGYSALQSDLLIRVPRSYPDAGLDMFWVAPEITLSSGQIPQNGDTMEIYVGRNWRRFSWHRQGSPWNPTVDNMHGHIEFIRRRLREKK